MNCYDLLIEILEAQAQDVDSVQLRDGSALKMVRNGEVVCLDHPGGELYIWQGYDGYNTLDTANGEPLCFPTWDDVLDQLDDSDD